MYGESPIDKLLIDLNSRDGITERAATIRHKFTKSGSQISAVAVDSPEKVGAGEKSISDEDSKVDAANEMLQYRRLAD